ncbi:MULTISPECIES: hypothetical protein [Mesorhizobium]|uniref:hypothetical protein n=1 Tax=Mesorhizobium TaxID=68287 RepID=UPI000BB04E86|nr:MULTISPECIES: hypothetical protein [Mesorhizobium]PBB58191.1 hypothetical protein CK217_31100 [Mesorhizobium loti]PBB83396.1 hypothetical protein CK216_28970 [Mesorhizobium sp. WSM3876]
MPTQKRLKNTPRVSFLTLRTRHCRLPDNAERDLGIDLRLNQSAPAKSFAAISTWRIGGDKVLAPNCSPADGRAEVAFKEELSVPSIQETGCGHERWRGEYGRALIAIATIGMDAPWANQYSGDLAM